MSLCDGTTAGTGPIQWGMAAQPLEGSAACGDQAIVAERLPKVVLVAVADGLGHGEAAAAAAHVAVSTAGRHAAEPVAAIMTHCHAALAGTRGAALSLASFDLVARTLTWLAVGNVSGVLARADRWARPQAERLILRGGIVGLQLPLLRAVVVSLAARDMLVIATDGLRADWSDDLRTGEPQRVAEHVLEHYATTTDDALVLAARYRRALE